MTTNSLFFRHLWVATLLLWAAALNAQHAPVSEHLTFVVEGLSTDQRDALVRDAGRTDQLRVVFACVPAGILVVESRNGTSRAQAELQTRALLAERSTAVRMRRTEQTLAQAEVACEQARNR